MENHLHHSCTIERPTIADDAFKQAGKTWAAIATGQRCRYVEKEEKGFSIESADINFMKSGLVFFPADADLEEGDRLSSMKLEDGTELPSQFEIMGILKRRRTGAVKFLRARVKEIK